MQTQPPLVQSLVDLLQQVHWISSKAPFHEVISFGTDLLPLIRNHWNIVPPATHAERRFDSWLTAPMAKDAQLCVWPLSGDRSEGEAFRLLWCPHGLRNATRIGVLSSHLGRRPDELREWFELLRAIVDQCAADQQIVVADKITARPWLEHLLADTNIPLLRIDCPRAASERNGIAAWLHRIILEHSPKHSHGAQVFLSPLLRKHDGEVRLAAGEAAQCPLADRVILHMADEIYLLRLQARGRLSRLLAGHLSTTVKTRPIIRLAVGPRLVAAECAKRLCERGCTIWRSAESGTRRRLHWRAAPEVFCQRPADSGTLGEPMLVHWTRARCGPWPDQSEFDFRDELLFDRPGAEHSALAALLRIAVMRRLCGSKQAIRRSYSVVCFTALPFDELLSRSVFRKHRGRWDFCPYGLCISQSWLESRGARQVIYGDDQLWKKLDDNDRPFFQLVESGRRDCHRERIDWRTEHEWRVVGDVDLSRLPAGQGWLFVPSPLEARWLAFVSRWPVRVLPIKEPAISLQSELVR